MGRLSKKRARKSPNTSDNNNSVVTYSPCSTTPFEADNVEIGLTLHLMLDDSVSNLIMSSTSRSKSIDNIKSELNTVFKQLTDMRSKVESLDSSLSKHVDLKQEIKTLSHLKVLLSKDIVPAELDDIIKAESVIDFTANEVTKRIVSSNNVIVYNIPDRIPIKTVIYSILKASNLQDSPCQCIRLNKTHQKYSCPVLFRFDSHILAERLKESERIICALTKFGNARIVSDKTTNQRLTQKRTLNENKGVEITTNHDASAAGSTDASILSHVLQHSDIPTKNANLPVMSVVTSDSQCTSNDVTNPISPSLPLEAHEQVLSSSATTLKNAVKTKIPLLCKKNVSTEPSGSRPNIKNTTMTLPNKNKTVLPDTMLYLTHRRRGYKGRLGSNVSQDGYCNHYVSRSSIGQTTMNQRILRLSSHVLNNTPVRRNYSQHFPIGQDGLLGYSTSNALNNKPVRHNYSQHFPIGQDGLLGYSTSNALNNKPVRHNYSQHFPIGQDGLLGYAPSTQMAGACLNCPPNQVQQINLLYQNNDFFGLQKSLVPLAMQFVQAIAHTISQT
ncbi:unnamed protein product [Schistosoma curassoni]|uniref:RRM domain-containing protein n=1 Tax=Schistosoma curassoni TaxID=6186 RepID=A0A183KE02_9TREM|nr:unnamed protein product [Schistosoma curassoni]